MQIRGLLQHPRFVWAFAAASAFTVIFLVFNLWVIGGSGLFEVVNTLLSPTVALIASYLFYQASTNKKDAASRLQWSGMAAGFGLWGIADTIWAFYAVILNQDVPYPSVADVIWTAGYIPLLYALILRLRTLKVSPSRRQKQLIIGLNSAWILITVIFILVPILRDFDPRRALEGLFNLLYPLADVALVVLSSLILILLREGRFSLIWRLIFSGIFLMTVSDLLFSYSSWHELYYPNGQVNFLTNLTDTTYTLAYISAAMGIYIYRFIWDAEEKFQLNFETLPTARYVTFIATNRENQLITVSNNFYYLVQGNEADEYHSLAAAKVLGMSERSWQNLVDRLAHEDILANEPVMISLLNGVYRKVWVTGMAFFDPETGYNGANFVFTSDIEAPETLLLPNSMEIVGMLKYLLSLAGSRPQDEIQSIKVYFLEVIRLLSSILYQFGGTKFRAALFAELDHTARKLSLPVEIDNQTIQIPDVEEVVELAGYLTPLLHSARSYVADLVGEQIVNQEIGELERQLSASSRKDLEKYHITSPLVAAMQ